MENDKSRKLPWVSIWMIGFSAMGLWMIIRWRTDAWSFRQAAAILVLGVIFIAGFRRSPLSVAADPGEEIRPGMEGLGALYLKAWRRLWREKWLLRFFGLILAVRVTGGMIEYGLSRYYLADRFAEMLQSLVKVADLVHTPGFVFRTPPLTHLRWELPDELALHTSQALAQYFPGVGLSQTQGNNIVLGIAFAVFALWAWNRMKRLADEQPPARHARLVLSLMRPAAVLLVITAVLFSISTVEFYIRLSLEQPARGYTSAIVGGVSMYAQSLVHSIFIVPLLLAGLIGSLRRSDRGEAVSSGSFLRDAAQHFKPMAGVFLMVWSISLVLYLPISLLSLRMGAAEPMFHVYGVVNLVVAVLVLLLVFVPYTVVTRGTGALDSIRWGVRIWLSRKKDVICYAALGITLVLVGQILAEMIAGLVSLLSPLRPLVIIVWLSIEVTVTAFVLVAIWEFYTRLLEKTKESPAVEGSAEA